MTKRSLTFDNLCDDITVGDIVRTNSRTVIDGFAEYLQDLQHATENTGNISDTDSAEAASDEEANKRLAKIRKFDEEFQLKYRGDKDYSRKRAAELRQERAKKKKAKKTSSTEEEEKKKDRCVDI